MICARGINVEGFIRPCGQCIACRVIKGRKWSARIEMESLTNYHHFAQESYFLTLTYNDDSLPHTLDSDAAPVSTLRKEQLRTFLKKQVRSSEGTLRYYAVGEYGDLSGRPHYHAAIFPRTVSDVQKLLDDWKDDYGYVYAATITPERARYLAGYTTKKLTAANDHRLKGNQEPEFRLSSRTPPLGADFADHLIERYRGKAGSKIIKTRGDVGRTVRIGRKLYPLGDYVLKRMRTELGIPLLERERREHAGYDLHHPEVEALQCENTHRANEAFLNGKKTRSLHRSTSPKL